MEPYIGITDFTDGKQVENMLTVFNQHLKRGSRRRLHVGVMMSRKTLLGLPTPWAAAFPHKEDIAEIFHSDDVYNCLHYADYREDSRNDPDFWEHLSNAISYGGVGIHAIQLDMTWPDPAQILNGVHTSRKQLDVILQVGMQSFEMVSNDPQILVETLAEYTGFIHGVLLDTSMGQGRPMNSELFLLYAHAIREAFPELALGVAGGLGPDTMHLVQPVAEIFPDTNIDAQGRLRPSGNALDPIDWNMAAEYLRQALAIL